MNLSNKEWVITNHLLVVSVVSQEQFISCCSDTVITGVRVHVTKSTIIPDNIWVLGISTNCHGIAPGTK